MVDQKDISSKKDTVYSRIIAHKENNLPLSYSRSHLILHGSVLLAVLAIYQNQQIGLVSYNNAFFLVAIICAVSAYGLWHCQNELMISANLQIIIYDKTRQAIETRWPNEGPEISDEQYDLFNYIIPLEGWPLRVLLPYEKMLIKKRDHTYFWMDLSAFGFYVILYISFLFNIIGAFFCFVEPMVLDFVDARYIVAWALVSNFLIMLFFFIRTKQVIKSKITKYRTM